MTNVLSPGFSSTARYLRHRLQSVAGQLQTADFGVNHLVRGELAEVWQECSQPGWDGYHSLPVTCESLELTQRLLRSMPLGSCRPSIGAEPDGQLTLEWGRTKHRRLSVSVSPDGDLHYAALLGAEKTCGTVPFEDELPETIRHLIRKVC